MNAYQLMEWALLALIVGLVLWVDQRLRWSVYEAWRREPSAKKRSRHLNLGVPTPPGYFRTAMGQFLPVPPPPHYEAGRCPHCGASLGHGRPGSMNPAGPPPIPPRPPR